MGGKKQPGRFTIQFNLSDPQQRQVIELLNEQGRRKAVFLTAAVLSYCGKNNVTQILPQPQMDLEAIENKLYQYSVYQKKIKELEDQINIF